jgi:uncharacterized protein (DUF2147 family)
MAKPLNMKTFVTRIALTAFLLGGAGTAFAKAPLEGRWLNPKGSVTVRIGPCGDGYCGTVIDASAKARATARRGGTPDLVGTQVMRDFKPSGGGTYKGHAFDPKRNIRAPATIRMIGSGTLVVRGCLISGIICKEQRWTRVG